MLHPALKAFTELKHVVDHATWRCLERAMTVELWCGYAMHWIAAAWWPFTISL
jgi:hypothetical protein